jgi:hypothetical protein
LQTSFVSTVKTRLAPKRAAIMARRPLVPDPTSSTTLSFVTTAFKAR